MGEITLVKLDLEGATSTASFTLNLPFSGRVQKTIGDTGDESEGNIETETEAETETETESQAGDGGGAGKRLAIVGVFVFLVAAVALTKYMMGDDDEDTDEMVADENRPVGVTVGEEYE